MRTIGIIRTDAYLNPIKVVTVKNLLGSGVLRLDLTAGIGLQCGDNAITTTGRLLESLAIDKANAAAHQLDQSPILELIGGLRDGGATCAE